MRNWGWGWGEHEEEEEEGERWRSKNGPMMETVLNLGMEAITKAEFFESTLTTSRTKMLLSLKIK